MTDKEMQAELKALKKRIEELESLKKGNAALFGRSYSLVGDSGSDLILKTKGLVKVLWGNKFIDLIKDGKVNVDALFITVASSVDDIGAKDGIYVVGDSVYLKVGGNPPINLIGEVGTTYVSFMEEQTSTSALKYTAMLNIGFLYKDISAVTENGLRNGIIYIESEQKLYTVLDGKLGEFIIDIPNPFTKLFVVSKNDDNKGAIVIKGSGDKNSLLFDSLVIYSDSGDSYFSSDGDIYIKIGDSDKIIIRDSSITFIGLAISNMFQSLGATNHSGFRLYLQEGESTLEVDNLVVRKSTDDVSTTPHPSYWHSEVNVIKSAFPIDNPDNPGEVGFQIDLLYDNTFYVGDSLYAYLPVDGENSKKLVKVPVTVAGLNTEFGNIIYIKVENDYADPELLSADLEKILQSLRGQVIFLAGTKEKDQHILRVNNTSVDIIESSDFLSEKDIKSVKHRFGNIGELGIKWADLQEEVDIEGYGIFSKQSFFEKASYISGYDLLDKDDSSNLASTEWVRKLITSLLPIGTIVAFHGDTIPEQWALCDGTDGTPNLVGKFIKADSTSGSTGGYDEIQLTADNIPSHDHSITGDVLTTTIDGSGTLSNLEESAGGDSISLSVETRTIKTDTFGNGEPLKWEPKYYSLMFIIKVK